MFRSRNRPSDSAPNQAQLSLSVTLLGHAKRAAVWFQRPEAIALLVILLLALTVRLWGIYFGLPYVYHVDEPFEVYRAVRLGMGDFEIERWAKGGYYLILFVEYGFYFVWSMLTGSISSVSDFAQQFVTDASPFWKIGRVTTALIGTGTVFLVWWQGRKIAGDIAGLLGAFFLAVSYEHVISSHYITVDVPATFFTFCAIALIVEDFEGRRPLRTYEFAPIAAFAVMCKLPMVLLFVPYFLASYWRGGFRGSGGLCSWQTWLPAFAAGAIYAVLNPGAILYIDQLFHFFTTTLGLTTSETFDANDVYMGMEQKQNLWWFYVSALIKSQGSALLFSSLVMVFPALFYFSRPVILHLSFGLLLFIAISSSASNNLYYDRYIVPILPGLCLSAGIGIAAVFTLVRQKFSVASWIAVTALAVFTGLIAYQPVLSIVEFDRYLARENPRTQAVNWIEKNVPIGSRVLLQGNPEADSAMTIPLLNSRANIEAMIERLQKSDPGKAMFWRLRLKSHSGPAFDLVTKRHFEVWGTLAEHRDNGVEYVVVRRGEFAPDSEDNPRRHQAWVMSRKDFYRELQDDSRARLVAEFSDERNFPLAWHLEVWKL